MKEKKENQTTFLVRLDKKLKEDLTTISIDTDRSLNYVFIKALEKYVEWYKK